MQSERTVTDRPVASSDSEKCLGTVMRSFAGSIALTTFERLVLRTPPRHRLVARLDGYSECRQQGRSGRKGAPVEIIGVIIAGIIIGLLGKWVAPGSRDNTPLWLTILCGIGGVIIGYYVAAALGVAATPGIDWVRWIISILVAAVLVMIAATLTGQRRGRLTGRRGRVL